MANGNVPATPLPPFLQYLPYLSGGLSGLGAIFSLIQNIQREKQLANLRKFYGNWQEAGNVALSRLAGDAASRGWSGYPRGLASNIASAYAPYQAESGRLIQSTLGAERPYANPFDAFLKALEGVRSIYPTTPPKDTGINFQAPDRGNAAYRFTGMNRAPFSLDMLE